MESEDLHSPGRAANGVPVVVIEDGFGIIGERVRYHQHLGLGVIYLHPLCSRHPRDRPEEVLCLDRKLLLCVACADLQGCRLHVHLLGREVVIDVLEQLNRLMTPPSLRGRVWLIREIQDLDALDSLLSAAQVPDRGQGRIRTSPGRVVSDLQVRQVKGRVAAFTHRGRGQQSRGPALRQEHIRCSRPILRLGKDRRDRVGHVPILQVVDGGVKEEYAEDAALRAATTHSFLCRPTVSHLDGHPPVGEKGGDNRQDLRG